MTPFLSLSAFVIGFMAVLLIGRVMAEVYANRHNKSPLDRSNDQAGKRFSTANKAIQRYYITYRKGA